MRTLADQPHAFNLAVSLHAPNDELRNRLVPVNDRIGIEAVLDAAEYYFQQTGRRITYEYVLLAGVNDQPEHAFQLIRLLSGRISHVNLIPMNTVVEVDYSQPDQPRTAGFCEQLQAAGIPATVRKRKGADIDAACGQLRLSRERPGAESLPAQGPSPGVAAPPVLVPLSVPQKVES
jgi:23S rRNA (adenine2503-C2)-methyltransferase